MRVLFNALSTFRQRTGVGQYAAHLLRALRRIAGDEVTPFPSGWLGHVAALTTRAIDQPPSTSPASSRSTPGPLAELKRRLRSQVRPAMRSLCEWSFRRIAREGYDLYHEPNFITWDCDVPTVVTVHDLSVVLHPEWHPRDRVAFHEERFARTLARCRHVLTVSKAMRHEIQATFGLRPDQVTAIPNGVRDDLRKLTDAESAPVLARLGLKPGYLLYVGTIEPRKNILTLMRSYCRLDDALRSQHPLVLAGSWGWGYERERVYFEEEARHRGVRHLGYVADGDLPALYSSATALVYPSRYEGFGLPPIEMMACGGLVLASTAPAIREVCGQFAQLIHPDDEAGWHDAMRRTLTNPDWRAEWQRGVIQHARRFTWQQCAEQTWSCYQHLVMPNTHRLAA